MPMSESYPFVYHAHVPHTNHHDFPPWDGEGLDAQGQFVAGHVGRAGHQHGVVEYVLCQHVCLPGACSS